VGKWSRRSVIRSDGLEWRGIGVFIIVNLALVASGIGFECNQLIDLCEQIM